MILSTTSLTMIYGKGAGSVKALSNIDLKIEKGSFVCIVGKSGSGKTTLLHVLAGLLTPTNGKVHLHDQSIYELSDYKRTVIRRKSMGFIFQFFNLFPELTVDENIRLMTKINKVSTDETYYKELLHCLGIAELLERYPSSLSGGQQQRVAIARSLIHKPSIVFADEPTGNLDEETAKEMIKLLQRVQNEFKQTIVLVTHDKDLKNYSNRIITLIDGCVVHDHVL